MNCTNSSILSVVCVFAISLVLGCNRDTEESSPPVAAPQHAGSEKPPEGPAKTRTPGETPPPLAPDFPKTELGELPTSEDLEREAENTVAIQNLEAELDRLEAEIVESPN